MGTTQSSDGQVVVGVPVATAAPHANPATDVVAAPAAAPNESTEMPVEKKLDLVFTFDCTGSMGQYISAAKAGITRIAERLSQAEGYDLRFGLVAYRDHPPQDMTFVTRSFPFTASLEEMRRSLGTLSAQGGGDGPEAVAAALKATNDADWRDDATKVCVDEAAPWSVLPATPAVAPKASTPLRPPHPDAGDQGRPRARSAEWPHL